MAWIESHQELAEHPKRKRLSRLLGASKAETIGLLHMLWWWAMDYAKDGDLSRFDDGDIADACDWPGDAAAFMAALIGAGFVAETRHIHDWHDYAGRLIEKREANAERMRKARAEREAAPKNERAKNVQRTCKTRVGLPNQTKPDSTNQTQPEGGSAHAHEAPRPSPSPDLLDAVVSEAGQEPLPVAPPLPKTSAAVYSDEQLGRIKAAIPVDMGRLPPAEVPTRIRHQLQQLVQFGDFLPGVLADFKALSLDETADWCAEALRQSLDQGPQKRMKHAARLIARALECGADLLVEPAPPPAPSKVADIRQGRPPGRPMSNAERTWAILEDAARDAAGG